MIIVFGRMYRGLEAYFCFTCTRISIYPRSPCNFLLSCGLPFLLSHLLCFVFKRFLVVNYNYNFNGKDRRGVTVLYFYARKTNSADLVAHIVLKTLKG